jgi:hypothetical protein
MTAPFNYFQTFIGGSAARRASSHHGRQKTDGAPHYLRETVPAKTQNNFHEE